MVYNIISSFVDIFQPLRFLLMRNLFNFKFVVLNKCITYVNVIKHFFESILKYLSIYK